MGNQDNPNMQTDGDKLNDRGRDLKRRGSGKKKEEIRARRKMVTAFATIMLIITLSGFLIDVIMYKSIQLNQSQRTPKAIYKALEVDNLLDLIEIEGDEKSGYYYQFKEGTEEKIDAAVKILERDGNKQISKDLIKKMIKAEVVNQFPFLQGAGSSSFLSGNTIAEQVWNYLIESGFTEEATAGVMGNIHQESGGFNPAIVENGGSGQGIGLCQWSYGRRTKLENFAAARGKDWTDLEIQLEYLVIEIQGGSGGEVEDGFNGNNSLRNQWQNAETPEQAAIAFEYGFERAGIPMMENRIRWANTYYQQFAGTYLPGDATAPEAIEDLKGILFIGDSIMKSIETYHLVPEGAMVEAEVGWSPSNWLENIDQLPEDRDDITGICIMLGTNDPSQIQQMKTLLDQLHERYPKKKIFVQKAIASPNEIATTETYNEEIQKYCQSKSYLTFMDTLDGVEYEPDNIHPTQKGMETLLNNMKDEVSLASGTNYLGEFSGTVRIRRVTPNKNIGEVKNTGVGEITDTTNYTPSTAEGVEIQKYIQESATAGTWSVYAKNLTSNSVKVNVNNQKLQSASLIKLFIMATAFEEIEKGVLPKNEVIDDIRVMINRSDNAATNRIIDKLANSSGLSGFDKINNYLVTHGYNTTEIHRKMLESPTNGDNYTSVMDVGNLLETMYRGTCVSQSASQEMIEILKSQTLKSKIPAGVPEGVETANKTGELSNVENDAAIVYKENAHYILVVMSNDVGDTAAARNNIKEISSKVYSMMNSSSSSDDTTGINVEHKVAIVAGHGMPSHSGSYEEIANQTKWYTTGTSGKTPSGETWNEWEITKKVANYVEQYLYPYSAKVKVVQVGYSQPNWERMQLAKDQGVDSYIGIHFNSSENNTANGVSAYYRSGDSDSQNFANILNNTVSNAMELKNAGLMPDSTSNNGKLDSIGHSSEWGFPSTIVEGGFMSNAGDMSVIGAENEEGLKRYAKGVAAGILQYYGIENTGLDGVTITNSETTTTTGINSRIYDLKYVKPDVFKKYVEENDRKALRTYTLEEETNKLIIANWSYTTEEGIKIEESDPINFRSVVNKYTMPIEYLIDFLVHTDDAEMVGKLADLAIHSEYIIAIQDNVTTVQTTVDIQQKDYTLVRVDTNEYWVKNYVDWHTVSKTITVKETVSNEIELTYADSWFVRFSKTSSYATASFNQNAGNDLTADEGEEIGDFKITVYCATCNDPPGAIETASGGVANAGHTIAVHEDCFNGEAMDGKLKKGSQVIINGQVYTVEDTGDPEKVMGDNWIGIFCESPCEEHGTSLESGNGTVKVYEAHNVEENDIEADNKNLKGINVVADVYGKVDDTTTVMEEYLGETRTPTSRRTETDVSEQKKITTVRTISNEYDSGKEQIIDQDLKDQQFIDVFLSCEGILRRFNMNLMAEILSKNEKTVNMIDLTKYLYNKAKDYENETESGSTYNFDVYKRNDLYHIYGSSNILEEFIKSLINNPLRLYMSNHKSIDEGEIKKYITTDVEEPSYRLYANEYEGRAFGFDIFHRLNENDWNTGKPHEKRIVEHYEDLSIDITPYVDEGQTLETETVDQVMRKEIQKWRDQVEDFLVSSGIQLEEYQIDALTVIACDYGWSQKDTQDFIEAYQKDYLEDRKEAFRENFSIAQNRVRPFEEASGAGYRTEEEEKQQTKIKLIWHLFDTGEYKTPEGEILDPDSFHGKGEILGVAEECWKKVCEKNPEYGGSSVPWTANQIDCSGYVSWVLYEYGMAKNDHALVNEFKGWQHTTESLKTVDWDKMGFEVIPVAAGENVVNKLQPGDILDRSVGTGGSGHTQIVVEVKDGQVYVYDCGSKLNWSGRHGESFVHTSFAASDSRPGIIIRKR